METSAVQPPTGRYRFRAIVGAILGIMAGSGRAPASMILSENPGDYDGSLAWAGRERTWLIHVPAAVKHHRPMPLVVALHGGGGRGEGLVAMSGLSDLAEQEGFLVVYPNGTNRLLNDHLLTWNAGDCCGYERDAGVDDVGFIGAMLDMLETGYPVDPARIFVTGMSNGGMLTHLIGSALAGRIAAIAPVAGALPPQCPHPEQPVAVIMFHGTADEHVPYTGGWGKKALDRKARRASVADAVRFWTSADGCSATPVAESSVHILTQTWPGGVQGTEVTLVTVNGGGHAWPGGTKGRWLGGDTPTREINASEVMW